MHPQIMTAAPASPYPPFTVARLSSTARRAAWRCIGFANILCALVVGCASPPAARSGADVEAGEAKVPAGRARNAAPDAADESSSPRSPSASLPWLTPSRIRAAVRAHHGDFQACQALGDVLSQRADGMVTVGWAVRANGSVNQVTLGPSTFSSDSINTCVLSVARQVTFPPSAAPAEVSWTVEFRGASRGPLADATPR
jgi:hypothetical protein